MYNDNTLTPREAIRLCALGTLAQMTSSQEDTLPYDDLVLAVRNFVSRMIGPSLELMGESIELLRYEGLVESYSVEGLSPALKLTKTGRETLQILLNTNLRASNSELNELIIALKLRFFHFLSPEEQKAQANQFIEICETEIARIEDLLVQHGAEDGHFGSWIKLEVQRLEHRLKWLKDFLEKL